MPGTNGLRGQSRIHCMKGFVTEPKERFGHLFPTSVIVSAYDLSVLEISTHEIDSIWQKKKKSLNEILKIKTEETEFFS